MLSSYVTLILLLASASALASAEVAFAFTNRLKVELAKEEHLFGRLSMFLINNAGAFSSGLYLAHFTALYLALRQAYLIGSGWPWWQLAMLLAATAAMLVLLVHTGLCLVGAKGATNVLTALSLPLAAVYGLFWPLTKAIGVLTGSRAKTDEGDTEAGLSINRINFSAQDTDQDTEAGQKTEADEFGNEVAMFQNALDFSSVKVKDSMVPRTEIAACPVDTPLDELRKMFVDTHFSRILVYRDSLDDVLGYVHSSDMFDNPTCIEQMLNPIIVVNEGLAANDMLRLFLKRKRSMALVVDEFGGTSGILTIEDVMEEIFGEIEDEHDEDDADEYVAKKIGEHEYVISARLEVEDVNKQLGLDLPLGDTYLTIGGLLLSHCCFLPPVGTVVKVADLYSFKIVRRSTTRITVVRLTVEAKAGAEAA